MCAIIGLTAFSSFAQSPEKLSYQAVVRNGSGDLITSGTVKLRFTVKSGSANGTTVYQESQNANPNSLGLVVATIGAGTVASGNFANINWPGTTFYLKVEMDPNGGTSYTDLGTTQLLSVPYALHAKTADALTADPQSLELRWDGATPFIDFSNDLTSDYDARLILGSDDQLILQGATLNIGLPGQTWTDFGISSDSRIGVTNGVGGRVAGIMGSDPYGGTWYSYDYENNVFANSRLVGQKVQLVSNSDNIDFYTQYSDIDGANLKLSIQENGLSNANWLIRNYSNEPGFYASSDNWGYLGRPDTRIFKVHAGTYYGNNTSIQSLSDRSLKTNVQPLSQGMSSLMQLRPVSYDFIPEKLFPTKEAREKMIDKDIYGQMGLIAQEVEEVFPGLIRDVEKEDGTVLKTVGYSGLIPVMVKAMQEQQQEIEALKAAVEKLSKR